MLSCVMSCLTVATLTLVEADGGSIRPHGQPDEQDNAARIDTILQAYHEQRRFNGVALVAENGQVVYHKGWGYANLEWSVPNSRQTKFRIGSLTKQFTAALVLRLVEEGLLRLDAPVRKYLPEYPRPQGDKITIHHLLTHTSGLPSYTNIPKFTEDHSRDPWSPEALVALTSSDSLEFAPGTRFKYSNSGYVLLGWLVEVVTGQTYDRALREFVLEPLGLHDTGYDHEFEVRAENASGYERTLTGYRNARYLDTSVPFAAGMLYSTAQDLLKWSRSLSGDQLFQHPGSKARMFTPSYDGYGYGVFIVDRPIGENEAPVSVIEHSGEIPGFKAVLRHIPTHDHTIILLENTSQSLGEVLQAVTRILYDLPVAKPKKSIAEEMLSIVMAEGVSAGLEHYRSRKETNPDDYELGIDQFFQVARYYLDEPDTATAIRLLVGSVEEFPAAPMPRFALAQVYSGIGDTVNAIAQLESALMWQPGIPPLLVALGDLGAEVDPVLRRPVVQVPPMILDRYMGTYGTEPGSSFTIDRQGPLLVVRGHNGPRHTLLAQSETEFLQRGSKIQYEFEVESGGGIAVTIIQRAQPNRTFRKANDR